MREAATQRQRWFRHRLLTIAPPLLSPLRDIGPDINAQASFVIQSLWRRKLKRGGNNKVKKKSEAGVGGGGAAAASRAASRPASGTLGGRADATSSSGLPPKEEHVPTAADAAQPAAT